MTGSSIFDYIHQADHAEVAEHLGLSLVGTGAGGGGGSGSGGGVNSPSSAPDEDGAPNTGTNNPDGMLMTFYMFLYYTHNIF